MITPCLDEVCGLSWWMDKNRHFVVIAYGFNDELHQTKVYYRPGYDFLEDIELAWETLANSKVHWVYDMEHDVLCVVGLGGHIGAVRFIARKFYGLDRIYH